MVSTSLKRHIDILLSSVSYKVDIRLRGISIHTYVAYLRNNLYYKWDMV